MKTSVTKLWLLPHFQVLYMHLPSPHANIQGSHSFDEQLSSSEPSLQEIKYRPRQPKYEKDKPKNKDNFLENVETIQEKII